MQYFLQSLHSDSCTPESHAVGAQALSSFSEKNVWEVKSKSKLKPFTLSVKLYNCKKLD